MSKSEQLTFNDKLVIITPGQASPFQQLFLENLVSASSADNFRYKEDTISNIGYFEVQNKYFSSRIEIEFLPIEWLLENLKNQIRPRNFIVLIDSLQLWEELKTNPKMVNLLKNSDGFKILIFEDSFSTFVNINQFYEQADCYVAFESIGYEEEFDNAEFFKELVDMLANHSWKVATTEKSKTEEPKTKKKPEKEDFLGLFDQISNFKSDAGNLSPRSRKNKACDIMQQLMEDFDFSGDDGNEEPDPEKEGYQRVANE